MQHLLLGCIFLFFGHHMRKIRKQPVGPLNAWNYSLLPGDRCWQRDHSEDYVLMVDLRESTGRDKAAAGDLTPHTVKRNGKPRRAVLADDGIWYWLE
jgi:hypothetical protein